MEEDIKEKVIKFENQGEKIEKLINNIEDFKSPAEIVDTFIKIYKKYGIIGE